MKAKLKLDAESLTIESFPTADTGSERGTVHARAPETHPSLCPPTEDVACSYGFFCTDVTVCAYPACTLDPDLCG